MSYVESNLVPGETVIYETRLHWIVMLWHIVLASLLLGLPGVLLLYYALSETGIESKTLHVMEGGGVALLLCGAIVILTGMIRRNATEMAVTNRRVVIKTGMASRKTIEMLLGKVESIEVSETAVGRMLGYGTILIIGTGGLPSHFTRSRIRWNFAARCSNGLRSCIETETRGSTSWPALHRDFRLPIWWPTRVVS